MTNEAISAIVGVIIAGSGILVFLGRILQVVDTLKSDVRGLNEADLVTHPVHARMCKETTERFLLLTSDLSKSIGRMNETGEIARKEQAAQMTILNEKVARIEVAMKFLVDQVKKN